MPEEEKMKITRKQLRMLIREAVSEVNESSKEYTETMWPKIDIRKELARINEKLIDLEEAIELMGGAVVSFKTRVEDIEVEKDKGIQVSAEKEK
jgi:hypothetical protein